MDSNLPIMTDIQKNEAPWNDPAPEVPFDICISQTLHKSLTIKTNDYVATNDGSEDFIHMYRDTSDTDWLKAYNKATHYTLPQLLEHVKDQLRHDIERTKLTSNLSTKYLQFLYDECDGWVEDETEIVEE